MTRFGTFLLLAGLVLVPGAAYAGPYDDVSEHRSVTRDFAPGGSQDGGACILMCNEDESPCDPIQYKTADGRCRDPFHVR
jgi:hypothetical protein